jgi:hypothetical protein
LNGGIFSLDKSQSASNDPDIQGAAKMRVLPCQLRRHHNEVLATESPQEPKRRSDMRSRLSDLGVLAVGDYAGDLSSKPYLRAKREHRYKSQSRQLADVIAIGNWLYKGVRLIEHNWRTEVLEGKTPYDPGEEKSIGDMLRQWMKPCPQCLEEIQFLGDQGVKVRSAVNFQAHCKAASEILAGRNAFFDDQEKAWKWSVLTAGYRPSPRPVRVDDAGRVFEMTGERYVPAGLTQEDVRRAFSGVGEGRTRTLNEIMATQVKNGLRDQAD